MWWKFWQRRRRQDVPDLGNKFDDLFQRKMRRCLADKMRREKDVAYWIEQNISRLIPIHSSRRLESALEDAIELTNGHLVSTFKFYEEPVHLYRYVYDDDDVLQFVEAKIEEAIKKRIRPLSAMGLSVEYSIARISDKGEWERMLRNECRFVLATIAISRA